MRQPATQRKSLLLLALILIGGALLRLYTLGAESFYFDEAYSVWSARHSASWLVALSTERIFPPLYYLTLHFWLIFGQSEFAVRLLSVVLGVGSLVAIYTLARQLFDTRPAESAGWSTDVGLLSACLLAISPLHIWFSQEARMYMLLLLLGLCSANLLLLALRKGGLWRWSAYILTTALAMNTHYFTLFLVLFENAFVLYLWLRRRLEHGAWLRWVLSQLAVAVLSVIGLAGIFSEESDYWWGLLDTWHGAATWRDLLNTVLRFSLGPLISGPLAYVMAFALFGFCALWAFISLDRTPKQEHGVPEPAGESPQSLTARFWRQLSLSSQGLASSWARDEGLVFTLLYLVVPVGAIFVISQFRSFWVLRYLFLFLPPYCILAARGLARMPGRALPALVTLAIVLVSLWPISDMYRLQQKEDWRGAVQYISAQEQPGDVLLMVDEDMWVALEHYYHGSMSYLGFSRTVFDRDFLAARVGLAASSHRRIWLVLAHTENLMLKDYLMISGYTELVSERRFMNVEVDLFTVQPSVVRPDLRWRAVPARSVGWVPGFAKHSIRPVCWAGRAGQEAVDPCA